MALIALTGCKTPQKFTESSAMERRDSLRVMIAENLDVTLSDVAVIPPDTTSPVLVAAQVVVRRRTAAKAEQIARIDSVALTSSEPAGQPPLTSRLQSVVALIALLLIIFALVRRQ